MKYITFLFFLNITFGQKTFITIDPYTASNENNIMDYVNYWVNCLDSTELLYNSVDKKDTNRLDFIFEVIRPTNFYIMDAYFVSKNIVGIETLTYYANQDSTRNTGIDQVNSILKIYLKKEKDTYKFIFYDDLNSYSKTMYKYDTKYLSYYYNKGVNIDKKKCTTANLYLDSIYKLLQLKPSEKSDYIISTDNKTMYKKYGISFSVEAFNSRFVPLINTVFDNQTGGFYKHELVHKAMTDAGLTYFNNFLTEGLASAISNETNATSPINQEVKNLMLDTISIEHIRKIIEEEEEYFFALDCPTSYCLAGLFFKSIIVEQGLKQVVDTLKPLQESPIKEVFQKLVQTSESPYPMVLEHIKKQYQKELN